MVDDFESKFYKELAVIEGIKKETAKLSANYKKLSKRIDQIEIQGIQDQLNSLHDILLETRRDVARFFILYMSNLVMETAINQKPKTSDHFISQLRADTAHARAQVDTSEEPDAVAQEFGKKAFRDAEKLGIKFVVV